MQSLVSDLAGLKPTDEDLQGVYLIYSVLVRARMQPFTTKSDFARRAANEIAILASEGMMSTKLDDENFTNVWMITG